jgi:hypothetical protein
MLQIAWRLTTAIALLMVALAVPTGAAFAGECDGTTGNDNFTCTIPVPTDGEIGLNAGDDTYVQSAGTTTDSVYGDGDDIGASTPGNGGSDRITIHGTVNSCVIGDSVLGDGGNDTIIISSSGFVGCSISGDDADNGGNDTITVNGQVAGDVYGDFADNNGGNDKITINGEALDVYGDLTLAGVGGNDTIVIGINGVVSNVYGDGSIGVGGNDTIRIHGYVDADVDGEDGNDTILIGSTGDVGAVYGADGQDSIKIYGYVDADLDGEDDDDVVFLGIGSEIGGTVYGGSGTDILQFAGITQADLDAMGLDPNLGSITIGGMTYFWEEFESLIGLLQELIASGLRPMFVSGSVLAVADEGGIGIFAEHARIAYVDFDVIAAMDTGAVLTFATPNAAGWYVTVTDLGVNGQHTGNTLFQVNIYNAGGTLVGQFSFAN